MIDPTASHIPARLQGPADASEFPESALVGPEGGLRMTEVGFGGLARVLLRIARDHAGGRCAALLEGGYDLTGLEKSTLRVLDEMGGEQLDTPLPEVASRPLLPQVVTVQRSYWELPDKS